MLFSNTNLKFLFGMIVFSFFVSTINAQQTLSNLESNQNVLDEVQEFLDDFDTAINGGNFPVWKSLNYKNVTSIKCGDDVRFGIDHQIESVVEILNRLVAAGYPFGTFSFKHQVQTAIKQGFPVFARVKLTISEVSTGNEIDVFNSTFEFIKRPNNYPGENNIIVSYVHWSSKFKDSIACGTVSA